MFVLEVFIFGGNNYYYDLFELMYIVPMVKITKIVFLLFMLLLSLGKPPHSVSGGVTQGRRKG